MSHELSNMISPPKSESERGHTWISESCSNTRIAALGKGLSRREKAQDSPL